MQLPIDEQERLEKSTDQKIDSILEYVDQSFTDGKFDQVNERIAGLDIKPLETSEICSWMMCVSWADDKLTNFKPFMQRCAAEIRKREPSRAVAIMRGFKHTDQKEEKPCSDS